MGDNLEKRVAGDFWQEYLEANDLQQEEMLKTSMVDSVMELTRSSLSEEQKREILAIHLKSFLADLIMTMDFENLKDEFDMELEMTG